MGMLPTEIAALSLHAENPVPGVEHTVIVRYTREFAQVERFPMPDEATVAAIAERYVRASGDSCGDAPQRPTSPEGSSVEDCSTAPAAT